MSSKMPALAVLIVNGPNLNLLGKREPTLYGKKSFEQYFVELQAMFPSVALSYFQSNVEGELIDRLQTAEQNGIVLNAGGYTHTSVSIRDAIASTDKKVVEVHLSNIADREPFRHTSLIAPVCAGCIHGFGLSSYALAIHYFLDGLGKEKE